MYAFKKVLIGIIQLSNLMRFTTINYKIKNSVSYLPTFLNGIQAAIEFDWNLKLGSSLYIKRLWAKRGKNATFARSARRMRNSRKTRDEGVAGCEGTKKTNIFGSPLFKLLTWIPVIFDDTFAAALT